MKRFGLKSLMFTLVLSLGLAGCGGGAATTSEGNKETGGTSANQQANQNGEKVLTIARGTDMVSFDVHNHQNNSTHAIHVNVFNSLVKRDQTMNFQPDLATKWEQVDDTTWRFHLREGVTFHNGDPFTAADVKYTLERVAKEQSLLEYTNYKQIKEVKVVDDLTVDIVTNGPDPILINRISRQGSGILPSKYIEEKGFDHFLSNPVGTGPYKFLEWKRDDRITFEKYDGYFGDKPKWDKVVFRTIPEDSTRVAELLTGGVDIATDIAPADWDRVKANENTDIVTGPTQRVMQLVLRMTEGSVTADPRVREAIELAIDKQAIAETILAGAAKPTRAMVTPEAGADPDLYGKSLYDPEKAKQLLKEAGYENGLELTFSSTNGRYIKDKEIAELIMAMLDEVGIKVKLEVLEWSKFNEKFKGKKFDELYMLGYGNSMFDASSPLYLNQSERAKGETDFNSPELDELLAQSDVNMDAESRKQQLYKVQQILAKERPRVFLFQTDAIYGVNKRIQFTPRSDENTYVDEIILK